jgi:hypothetical protein
VSLPEDSLELVLAEPITPGTPKTTLCTGRKIGLLAAFLVLGIA